MLIVFQKRIVCHPYSGGFLSVWLSGMDSMFTILSIVHVGKKTNWNGFLASLKGTTNPRRGEIFDPRWPVWGTLMELEFRVRSLNKLKRWSWKLGEWGRKINACFWWICFLFFKWTLEVLGCDLVEIEFYSLSYYVVICSFWFWI